MNAKTQDILERFVNGEKLNIQELRKLKNLFAGEAHRAEINLWLENNWQTTGSDDLEIRFDNLKIRVQQSVTSKKGIYRRLSGYSNYYQRIAAVLFVPLILGMAFYWFSKPDTLNLYMAEAPMGQKAKIELADGSIVWLNSGSKIRYSSDFNQKNRNLELDGEAFFEVKKNTGNPFIVHTSLLDVKVTGTRFNVNAYSDEPIVETSLVEGKVNVLTNHGAKNYPLVPGKVLTYSKSTHEISTRHLNEEAAIGWKENRLIFINDDFSRLARKIEKWYNVKVVYNQEQFKYHKLTVKLLEGEQLNKLLEIIESAMGAKCTIDGNTIQISKL